MVVIKILKINNLGPFKEAQYDFSSLMTEYDTMSREKDPQWSELLEKFEKRDLKAVPQDESKVTFCKLIKKEDGIINK